MKRFQEDTQHEYRATPPEYDISQNEVHSTYDQFIQLRDTIIYSSKVYADNAGRSLIIWIKADWSTTNTIEIRTPNIFNQKLQPWYESDPSLIQTTVQWSFIEKFGWSECKINQNWRYRISHKEQLIWIDPSITRVTAYILQTPLSWPEVQRAVFDWEWDTAGEIKRLTSFGYIELNLQKGDRLWLHVVDQDWQDIDSSQRQQDSNRWQIEYLDLPYNLQ